MSKVLVTGATGFLGSYLCRLLIQQGYQVKAIRRANSQMDLLHDVEQQIEWLKGDIMDATFLEKAVKALDIVFHCAAIVSFSPKGLQKMMYINVKGTSNIVNACLVHQVKLIHVSSIAAIGRSKENNHITEQSNWEEGELNTPYAKSKYLAELEVWEGHRLGLEMGIVNPSIILGSGYWDNGSCKLFKTVLNGLKFYPLGHTGFVDVRDVAQAMLAIIDKKQYGNRFIVNGRNTSYRYLFEQMAINLGVKAPYIPVIPFLRELSWRLEKIRGIITQKHPFITKDTALISSLSYTYANQKSIEELDMRYRPLEATIEASCNALLHSLKTGELQTLDYSSQEHA